MHKLVKIITDDDGELTHDSSWHYVDCPADSPMAFCSGQVFGLGESSAKYEEKTVDKGGITCKLCLARIKEIKDIKL